MKRQLSESEEAQAQVARKVLLVKGFGGLGNRLEVVLGGMLYARLSQRELVVDWSDPMYSADGSNAFRTLFQCRSLAVSDDLSSMADSVYPAGWRGHLGESLARMGKLLGYDTDERGRQLSIDMTSLDYDEQVLVLHGFNDRVEVLKQHHRRLLPELAQLERPQILAKLLAEEIIPAPEVRRRVDDFKRTHFAGPTVGVHIRFSDYRIRLLALLRQLNTLLKQYPDLQVFVATDNEAMLRLIQRHYSRVITVPHWFDPEGVALHKSTANRDRTQSAIEALTDLYLLAECDYLVVDSASSFSYLASVLSKPKAGGIRDVNTGGKGYRFLGPKGNRRARKAITSLMQRTRASTWGVRAFGALVPIRYL